METEANIILEAPIRSRTQRKRNRAQQVNTYSINMSLESSTIFDEKGRI